MINQSKPTESVVFRYPARRQRFILSSHGVDIYTSCDRVGYRFSFSLVFHLVWIMLSSGNDENSYRLNICIVSGDQTFLQANHFFWENKSLASVTSPVCQVCRGIVLRPWKELCMLWNRKGQRRWWMSGHFEEGWREHSCTVFHLANREKATDAFWLKKYGEDKGGSVIQTRSSYSCSLFSEVAVPGGSDCLLLEADLSSSPYPSTSSLALVFDPLLTFGPTVSSFKLDVWSIHCERTTKVKWRPSAPRRGGYPAL